VIRILNAEPDNYSPAAKAILDGVGEVVEQSCDRERLLALMPGFEVLIVRLGHRVDAELLSRGRRLRAVVSATTGLNHIDQKACAEVGVAVLCLKGEREFLDTLTATAELTWGLLLGLMRRLPAASAHVAEGGWERDLFRGRQLKNKVLGILGYGRLGSIVADYGRAFRMQVVACDPLVESTPDWVEKVTLSELLQRSDVVSLHVNLEPETEGMLGEREFSQIKPGSVLVNTSRGELVDESAMLKALASGRLAGAALDVLAGEGAKGADWPAASPVWQYATSHENLLLVPHLGGATLESMEETEIFMARKLERYFLGSEA
jgi:D-3-phosphoglycerate dehydrogenase